VEDAAVVVLNEVLQCGPDASGLYRPDWRSGENAAEVYCRVRFLPEVLPAGEEVVHAAVGGPRFRHSVPYDSWFFFIDDNPLAPYHHECRYVFVDAKEARTMLSRGHVEVFCFDLGFPPFGHDEMLDLDITLFEFETVQSGFVDPGWRRRQPRGPQPN